MSTVTAVACGKAYSHQTKKNLYIQNRKETTTMDFHLCENENCRHQCEQKGCDSMILYHDEPYCFSHSPDEGSSFRNYDSRTGGWK